MPRVMLAVLVLVLGAGSAGSAVQQAAPLDPAGTYSVSTTLSNGQPMSGTLVIESKGGVYGGRFMSPALPDAQTIAAVGVSGRQLMVTLQTGNELLLVWVELAADGTYKGTWHQLSAGTPVSGKKTR
jgi:hypothetical protein